MGRELIIEFKNQVGKIHYVFPTAVVDFTFQEHFWFCPALLSLLHMDDFFRVLRSVLLESSVVFVSNNITLLSAAILGLKALIKPFRWCFALVPVLPSALLDILDTPQPILVGITSKDYEDIDLTA